MNSARLILVRDHDAEYGCLAPTQERLFVPTILIVAPHTARWDLRVSTPKVDMARMDSTSC